MDVYAETFLKDTWRKGFESAKTEPNQSFFGVLP